MGALEALVVLLLAVGAAAAPAAAASPAHNVLERFPATSLRWAVADMVGSRGIKIDYNSTQLKYSGDWVRRCGSLPSPKSLPHPPLSCRA